MILSRRERGGKRAKEHSSYHNTLAARNGHLPLCPARNHGNSIGPESHATRRHQAGAISNGTYIHELPWNLDAKKIPPLFTVCNVISLTHGPQDTRIIVYPVRKLSGFLPSVCLPVLYTYRRTGGARIQNLFLISHIPYVSKARWKISSSVDAMRGARTIDI